MQSSPQEALLAPQLIKTLVNKVAAEVSRRLSPAENPSSLVPALPSGLHEVPVNAIGSQSSSSTVTTDLIASTVVQGSLADVSAAVTGLVPSTSEGPPPVSGQCFQSVSNNYGKKSGRMNLLTLALFLPTRFWPTDFS